MADPATRLAAVLAAMALACPAAAGEPPATVTVDWAVDGAITGGALALWIGSEAAKDSLAPASCRWCAAPGFDVTVRDAVAWADPRRAATASNLLVAAVPAGMVLYDAVAVGGTDAALPDLLIMGEAMALSGVVTQATKLVAARTRPYAAYGTLPSEGVDDHLSFYSGHTAIAFSAVAAGGMLARLRGDPAWPWVYGLGFTAAAATGYFRMAADKHWLSDVLMGAATGTAVGLAVPWLHRNRSDPTPARQAAVPAWVGISGQF